MSGYGIGGGVGFGTETTPGTGVAADSWLDFASENIASARGSSEDNTIYGDGVIRPPLPGLRSGAGGTTFNVSGGNIGRLLNFWNGKETGAYDVVVAPGLLTAAPTGTPSSGGSLAAGDYLFAVASVWKRDTDDVLELMPMATVSSTVTTAGGNLSVDLAWADPSALTPPSGWTHAGTAIFRGTIGGSASTLRLIHYVPGTGNSYTVTGAETLVDAVSPVTGPLYMHTFKRVYVPGSNPLQAFSTTVVRDNDFAQRFLLCRMNNFVLAIPNGESPITSTFEFLARDVEKISNPVISHTPLRKMMGWQTQISLDGVYSDILESLTINGTNNCDFEPGLSGNPRNRDIGFGGRKVTGTFARKFADHAFWDKMMGGDCPFGLRAHMWGGHIDNSTCNVPNSVLAAYPFQYSLLADLTKCIVTQAGGNVGGPGRITENVSFQADVDPATGTDIQFRLFNLNAGPYN